MINKHPSLHTAFCIALETTINKALAYDPGTANKLKPQAGRCVSLELSDPDLDVTLTFTEFGIQVSPLANAQADCHLKGQFSGLIALANGPKNSLAGSDLRLSGHTGFLMELLDIAKQLDIDWEAFLAEHIAKLSNQQTGDTVGHSLAEILRYKGKQVKRLAERSPDYLRNLITEELNASPSKHELDMFYRDVDQLHQATERAAARLHNIKQKLISE